MKYGTDKVHAPTYARKEKLPYRSFPRKCLPGNFSRFLGICCLNLNSFTVYHEKKVDAICSIYFCRTLTVSTNSLFLINQQFFRVK